jgi:putative membrane-bound dehydrogenase-like protein
MNCLHRILSCVLIISAVAAPQAAQYHFSNQTFTVPDGFVLEQIAGPPLVDRPISGSLDEEGRLYVTDSSGSNDKVEKQLAEKPHRVMRLEAVDAQGRFTKSSVFAEHMMFPEGCLWFDGSLYVSAPPSIWKLTDTNDDGIADTRSEWHQGKTLTGCANDLHGPYLGLDGWIYWCKGAFARQTYERPGRKPIDTRASHIFRAPPDHSDLEPVLTAGMDNPVGVVFTLEGERFMCGTFLMHPQAGLRDGVVHAVYGGVFGKPNDVLDNQKKTGELMPIMTQLGAAAPCSVIRYESESFGADYQNNLFVCSFNMHKVTRHVLVPEGATFKTIDSDFLISDSTDFHPTDVIEDADGSLIVIDTGGWYKLCCPTSQLSKPDVLGAVYRVRRIGAPAVQDPRGLELSWGDLNPVQLANLLKDGRPAVRKRALQLLARIGAEAVPALAHALKSTPSAQARAYTVWALTRIQGGAARAAVRMALEDPAEFVKHAAIQSAALWRDASAAPQLLTILRSPLPPLQRAAAEALGRIGAELQRNPAGATAEATQQPATRPETSDAHPKRVRPDDVAAGGEGGRSETVLIPPSDYVPRTLAPALLEAATRPADRFLEHSIIFALIEIDQPSATGLALKSGNVHETKVALIALDQMDGGGLHAQRVTPLLSNESAELRATALWISGHHPEWGGELASYFSERLSATAFSVDEAQDLKHQLGEFTSSKAIQGIIGTKLTDSHASRAVRQVLLETIAGAAPKEPPTGWIQGVIAGLADDNPELLRAAVGAARTLEQSKSKMPELSAALLGLAHRESLAPELRLESLAAGSEGGALDSELLALACSGLDSTKPVQVRGTAASVLAKSKLTKAQLLVLADSLRTAGPLEAATLLQAFEHSSDEEVGSKLVSCLKNSKGLGGLRAEAVKKVLDHFPASVQQEGKELLASLEPDDAKDKARLEDLLAHLGKGDVRRGQAIFNSAKAACSSCHSMGYLGGHVGPDLTSIGQVRTERDLLESIVFPSASFVRSFEPYIIKTKSDEEYSGVLKKDAPDEVILATGPTTEARIARSDIVDIRPGTVSVMPAGLDQQLTRQELADLVAFLKGTKWGAN